MNASDAPSMKVSAPAAKTEVDALLAALFGCESLVLPPQASLSRS